MSEPHDRFMAAVLGLSALAVSKPLNDNQKEQLGAALPRDVIKTRPQGGQQLKYIEGWYVIEHLNAVFGYDGWTFDTGAIVVTTLGDRAVVHVPVTLRACGVSRSDVGVGVAAGKGAEALETAIKGAVTDGLKRAARTFGTSFGNRLYDKVGSGIGVSTKALAMLDEIDAAPTVDAVNAWAKTNAVNVTKLERDEQDIVKGACAARRRELTEHGEGERPEQAAPPPQPQPQPQPTPPAARTPESFYARVDVIELPGEAVAVWLKHRDDLHLLGVDLYDAAWKALCERTGVVGKMAKPDVWLKKALAEEDALAARRAPTESPALATYRARCALAPSLDALTAVCLELAPTVAQHREDAWGVAVRRAADLGADEPMLKDLVGRAAAITKEPAVWKVAAEVLVGLAAATTRDGVAAVVKRHGGAVAKLPKAISEVLLKARDARLAEITPVDLPAQLEDEIKRATSLPDLDAAGERVERELAAGRLTPDQAKALTALHEKAAAAMEMAA